MLYWTDKEGNRLDTWEGELRHPYTDETIFTSMYYSSYSLFFFFFFFSSGMVKEDQENPTNGPPFDQRYMSPMIRLW